MKGDAKAGMDKAFEKYSQKQKAAADKKKIVDDEKAAYLSEFHARCEDTIRPAMQEIGEYLKGQGWTYDISLRNEEIDSRDKFVKQDARITMTMFPDGKSPVYTHDYPSFSAICHKAKLEVGFHESTMMPKSGGTGGGAGSCKLEDLTADLIQEKLSKLVQKLLERLDG